ncbi:hypothetical protein SDC9_102641 [bioreactor metagenome]|uniref:Uncharacterized protein n=1 Tax=bioreactor metagenome TaxID=1076179 RepID=A0A645B2B4_9ZZZZ
MVIRDNAAAGIHCKTCGPCELAVRPHTNRENNELSRHGLAAL